MPQPRSDLGWRWAVAGGVAGLLMDAAMFGVGVELGTPTLPELLQDHVVALLPGALFGYLVDQLQFAGKPLLLVGLAAAQALVGVALGWAVGRWRGRLGWPEGAALGVLAWLLLQGAVVAWANEADAGVGSAGLFGISALVYGLGLTWAGSAVASGALAADHGRRRTLVGLAAGGASLALAGALARLIGQMGEQGTPPAATGSARGATGPVAAGATDGVGAAAPTASTTAVATPTPAPVVVPAGVADEITPNDRFYVVSKNFVDPRVRADAWRLEVLGLVKTPRPFSYEELQALPTSSQYVTLECISNALGGPLMSNALWTGVRLADLLGVVGLQPEAGAVEFHSADNYHESVPLAIALAPTTLLAHTMGGAPLPDRHGFPVRVVLPGRYGMKNPKWLTRIELVPEPVDGYWVRRGWDREALPQTIARIDTPRAEATVSGPPVPIGGVAYAGTRGIARVDVSTDGGATWRQAATEPPLAAGAWTRWALTWEDVVPGAHVLLARATDGAGTPQPVEEAGSFPRGATGYHRVGMTVLQRP